MYFAGIGGNWRDLGEMKLDLGFLLVVVSVGSIGGILVCLGCRFR